MGLFHLKTGERKRRSQSMSSSSSLVSPALSLAPELAPTNTAKSKFRRFPLIPSNQKSTTDIDTSIINIQQESQQKAAHHHREALLPEQQTKKQTKKQSNGLSKNRTTQQPQQINKNSNHKPKRKRRLLLSQSSVKKWPSHSLSNIMMHMKSYRTKHKHKNWSERTLFDSSSSSTLFVSPPLTSIVSPPPPLQDRNENESSYPCMNTPSSMDTKKSTPRAKSSRRNKSGRRKQLGIRSSFSRCDTEKVVNRMNDKFGPTTFDSDEEYQKDHCHDDDDDEIDIKYELPPSVSFLSLILPCAANILYTENNDINHYCNNGDDDNDDDDDEEEEEKENIAIRNFLRLGKASSKSKRSPLAPSIISVSDATTATSTTGTGIEDIGSMVSGQTTLAKDRLQETIASFTNIDYYLESTHTANQSQYYSNDKHPCQDMYHHLHASPVNVDFVLESNEGEIASFANSFIQSKQYTEAINIYLAILDHYQIQHGHDYPFVISTLHNLGVAFVLNGNYKEALYYCKEALKRREKRLGSDHIDVATSLCELGIIYYAREDFNKGIDVFRQALHIVCNRSGTISCGGGDGSALVALSTTKENNLKTDCKVASILNNIACFHYSMGKLIASVATFEESLDVMRRIIGTVACNEVQSMLLSMSITLCNAGIVSAKHDQLDVASSLVEEGLMVQQSILPDDHRLVRSTNSTLSNLLNGDEMEVPRTPIAIQNVEIQMPRQMSNSSHRANKLLSRCTDMLTLGPVYDELNSQQRVSLSAHYKYLAEAILVEGDSKRHCSWVDVQKQSNGEKEYNLSEVCEKAARLIQQKQLSKATTLFDQVRQSHANKCGDVDYIVGSIHHILGIIYLHSQNYRSARSEFQRAAKMRSLQLDPDNLDVLASKIKRAITLVAMQDFEKALSIFQSQLTQMRKRFGYANYRVALILNNIGVCHFELGGLLTALKTFEESVEILRDAIAHLEKEDGNERYNLLLLFSRSLNNLSYVHFKRKQYAEASVVLEECLKTMREAFGNSDKMVTSTVKCLGFVMATANCLDNKDKLDHMTKMYVEMLGQ